MNCLYNRASFYPCLAESPRPISAYLVTGYDLTTLQAQYEDLGGNHFNESDREAGERRAVKRLEKLSHQVQAPSAANPTR